MRILPAFVLLLCLYGYGQRTHQTDNSAADSATNATSTAVSQPDTMCFRQVVGRDSTLLQLVINNSTVTGKLTVLPYEKDRAQGTVQGKLRNNQILATWQRSGEGVMQVYEVVFTLKGDAVTWREGERVEKQGKWILKNPNEGYTYVLMKAECL